jgi:acetyl-CoA synthetase
MTGNNIHSVLQETRSFPPPADFTRKAHISSEAQYQQMWNQAKDDPAAF